jgi:ABC-type multidrug transport system fused ATPase/permease subunit
MKTKSWPTLFRIALCFLLLVNVSACSWFSSETTTQQSGATSEAVSKATATVQKAEEELLNAQKEVQKAKQDAEIAKRKAADARAKATQLADETRKAGKDPNNAEKAPKTTAAMKEAGEAEAEAKTVGQKVETATTLLKDAEQRVEQARRELEIAKNGSPSPLSPWLLYLLAALGTLVVLIVIVYSIIRAVNETRTTVLGHLGAAKKRQEELSTKMDSSMAGLKNLNERLVELKKEVRSLSDALHDGQREILDGVRSSSAAAASGYSGQVVAQKENVHTFPVSADDYLAKVRRSGTLVKPDFQYGILVQDLDGNGELVLVQDSDAGSRGLFYVVPKVGYFQTKQDFYNYYEKYYDCPRPSSGDVWIVEPAIVDKVSGGWELRRKGELEIK